MYYLLLAVVAIVLLVYKYITWNDDFWKKRGVPYEESKFFFGSIKDQFTGKKHFGQICQEIYNNYNEKVRYVGFMKLLQPTLLLRDPDLIKDVLLKDFTSFSNTDFQVDPNLDPLLHSHPFAQKDVARWRRIRGHFTPTVTNSKIKLYFSGMEDICNIMVNYIKQETRENNVADFEGKELSGKYTTDVIAKAVFGVENNTFENEQSVFFKITSAFFSATFLDNIKLNIIQLIPKLASILRIRIINKDVQDKILKITRDILAHRQQSSIKRNFNDFFQQMINYRENVTANEFTDIYIASHAFEFIVDGYETSSSAISYILHELAWNQDVQNQLREEINASMKETQGRLSFEHLHAMKYLDRVVSESLRMHPPGLTLSRICTKNYEFPPPKPGGKPLKMEVGGFVNIPIYALHMDPQYFPEPEKFNPDNFTEEAIASRHKFSYLPFGEGPRVCPGFRFALIQSKAAIVSIVYNFKIKPSPKSPYPTKIDPNMFLMKSEKDVWVQLEEIKK